LGHKEARSAFMMCNAIIGVALNIDEYVLLGAKYLEYIPKNTPTLDLDACNVIGRAIYNNAFEHEYEDVGDFLRDDDPVGNISNKISKRLVAEKVIYKRTEFLYTEWDPRYQVIEDDEEDIYNILVIVGKRAIKQRIVNRRLLPAYSNTQTIKNELWEETKYMLSYMEFPVQNMDVHIITSGEHR
jgi:hypothetical protein